MLTRCRPALRRVSAVHSCWRSSPCSLRPAPRGHPARERVGPAADRRPRIAPLEPAQPGADPVSFLAWMFTPIFQVMFIILFAVYQFLEDLGVPAAIGWAIIVLTLIVRAVVIPLYRRQLVSQRRMQLLQPEMREISRRYKGDSMKVRAGAAGARARSAASARLPAASRSCSRCRCC